jgi:hypothetical protein
LQLNVKNLKFYSRFLLNTYLCDHVKLLSL